MIGPTAVASQESHPAARFPIPLSQLREGCLDSDASCQYFRGTVKCCGYVGFECLLFSLLVKHNSFTLWGPCSGYKYFNSPAPVFFLGWIKHIFLPLPSGWLIHTLLWIVAAEKQPGAARSGRQGFLYVHLVKGCSANEGLVRLDM